MGIIYYGNIIIPIFKFKTLYPLIYVDGGAIDWEPIIPYFKWL